MTEYLTIRDAFERLGVGEWVLRRAISKGELKVEKVSRKLFPMERWTGLPQEIMAIYIDEFQRFEKERDRLLCKFVGE